MAENFGTIIVSILLAVSVAAAILSIIKNKKAGRSSCGGDCAHCMMQAGCKREDRTER